MVNRFDTHWQRGFLMGMEAICTGDSIMAPVWYRQPSEETALFRFNLGVEAAYTLAKFVRLDQL